MKIEAKNLEQALLLAASQLGCSVVDVEYEIIQQDKKGLFGLFAKNVIIEAKSKKKPKFDKKAQTQRSKFEKKPNFFKKEELNLAKKEELNLNKESNLEDKADLATKPSEKPILTKPKYTVKNDEIFNSFHKESGADPKLYVDEIRMKLESLLRAGEFGVELTELNVYDKDSIYIKLEGEDAALLIGKEAYRYKALSYLLHNWINSRYKLLIRLEIADFLKNQSQSMDFYLQSIIERVEATGKAQTKPLDGVLVKLALEKLRERFPNKYVGIKQNGEEKIVIINDFLKKNE
ncbi:Jag N-terminal domain-containing protein [Campylobacter troglodytis]|uniref:Jag N-terminal domain-containing protein n=1 Tax=Campylobacter troglodytis TaxID=654363 RepID=UPI00115C2226|nr:Jag N-terminal domain-containing protein [Campylobacter troglodytis]TQR60843.1 protein jag [Campylobacter troglodytis]